MDRESRPRVSSLEDFTGPCKQSGAQLNYKACPVCGSDDWKVYVDPETGKWICFAGQHGRGGVVDVGLPAENPGAALLRLLAPPPPAVEGPAEISLPPNERLSSQAIRYLQRRNVDLLQRVGLREWVDEYRILIPVFAGGVLAYWTSRRYSKNLGGGPKYISAPGQPYPFVAPGQGALVLVEGVFDAWAVQRAGYRAMCLFGKTFRPHYKKALLTESRGYGKLVVMLDSDALSSAMDLARDLPYQAPGSLVQVVLPPRGRDPGDMSPEEIRRAIDG